MRVKGVFSGQLVGIKVVVWDLKEAKKIYSLGFYGKPFGIRKPKGLDWNSPLELSILEAYYLVDKGVLKVYDGDRLVSPRELREYCEKHLERFSLLYPVYRELREKGYVVRSGLKFGCDFAVYERGPGIDHAPYIVHVMESSGEIDPIEIVRAGRLSHSVRKRFIVASVNNRTGEIKYIMFDWYRP